jgi:hypothetical protein
MARVYPLFGVLMTAAILAASTPLWSQEPSGWAFVGNDKACGATKDGVVLATPDGVKFGLVVNGVNVGDQPMRTVQIDGKPFLLRFAQSGTMAYADLDSGLLGALASAKTLSMSWGDKTAEIATADLMPVLNRALICGAALQTKRVAEAEKAAKAARRRAALSAFMSEPGAPPVPGAPMSTMPQAGMVCLKKREWASGFNKNCVYDCLGSEAVQTVGSAELCPLTMSR